MSVVKAHRLRGRDMKRRFWKVRPTIAKSLGKSRIRYLRLSAPPTYLAPIVWLSVALVGKDFRYKWMILTIKLAVIVIPFKFDLRLAGHSLSLIINPYSLVHPAKFSFSIDPFVLYLYIPIISILRSSILFATLTSLSRNTFKLCKTFQYPLAIAFPEKKN